MSQQVLRWIHSQGWLVLSGGIDQTGEIRAQVLERAVVGDGIAYVSFAEDGGDALIEDMDDLGAPSGYVVDLKNDRDDLSVELITQASVIVIQAGDYADELYFALLGTVVADAIVQAMMSGAIVLIEGIAANMLGRWYLSDDGQLLDGLNWVENALILPGVRSPAESEIAQAILAQEPATVAIGVGVGSAIAFGPDGRLETWAAQQVTVSLGSEYQQARDENHTLS